MEQTITAFEVISFIGSIASLILAIVAIWLSFKFFEKSSESSEKTNEAAKGISSSVERLEKLFDKLYSDTFSVMKDTVSDMRKHLWSDKSVGSDAESKIETEAENKAESKITEIRSEISNELSKILQRQKIDRRITEDKIANIKEELTVLFEKAISESRNVENIAREETIREFVLRTLRNKSRRMKTIEANDFLSWIQEAKLNPGRVFKEMEKMAKENILWLSRPEINGPSVEIRLK